MHFIIGDCILKHLFFSRYFKTKIQKVTVFEGPSHKTCAQVFQSGHQIPFKCQQTASKNKFLPFLPHEKLAHFLIDFEVHFVLTNQHDIALDLLLVSNSLPDTLQELFDMVYEGQMHFVLKEMLYSTLRLLLQCVRHFQHLPLNSAIVACPCGKEVAKLSKC